MRRSVRPAIAVAAVVFVLAGCSSGPEVADFGEPQPEDGPTLAADDGLDLAEVEDADPPPADAQLVEASWPETAAWTRAHGDGEPVLHNLFASWCGPCERELPLLVEPAEAGEVTVLGINHQDRREAGEEMLAANDVESPTLFAPAGDVAYAIGARGLPTTAAFDADGQLVSRVVGELTESRLDELLAELE